MANRIGAAADRPRASNPAPAPAPLVPAPQHLSPPLLVWGGGSGGVAAALQAARAGTSTLLLTPGPWLGGMVSAAGVCAPDGNELSPWQTGLWGALLRALAQADPCGLDHNWVSCFGYLPATAERILRQWLQAEPLLQWWPCCQLEAVQQRGDRITALRIRRRRGTGLQPWLLQPRLVVDGSDRGDLLGLCGSGFRLGWEAQELWQEPSAPPRQRLEQEAFFQDQPVQSPTWVVLGQLQGPPPPSVHRGSEPALPQPFSGALQRFGLERTLTYGRLPGDLVMLNWPLHGNDWPAGLDRAFTDLGGADPACADPAATATAAAGAAADAAQLQAEMQAHSRDFLHSLTRASDGWLQPGRHFPTAAAARAGALSGSSELALMPYWREGRRLVGQELVVEQDLLPLAAGACRAALAGEATATCTAIAVGNYANDHHYPGGDWPLAAKSCRWGGRWSGTPFTIPYGALVSARFANLLAADKCLSVSHMANGATRLQPLVLNLGQAAGQAAALCLQLDLDPAELPVLRLQEALIADPHAPAAPLPLWDTPWHHRHWRQRQLEALRDPGRLDRHGHLQRSAPDRGWPTPDPASAPAEPGEQLWRGELEPDGEGGYSLRTERRRWPLITLEPALHHWLLDQQRQRPVALIGCANPWGPWLRVSRLAD